MFLLNVRLINNSRETGMDDEETTDIYHHAANNKIVNMGRLGEICIFTSDQLIQNLLVQ